MKKMYETKAVATGGRDGSVRTADGMLELKLATPKEMGGPGGASNPEQLFAAGYAACFLSAFKLAASQCKQAVRDASVEVTNSLMMRHEGGFVFSVEMTLSLTGMEKELAEELAVDAEHICPFANSTRGNIETKINVVIK